MKARRKLLTVGVLLGSSMMLSPLVGIAVGLRTAFRTLGASGLGDPRSLSGAVAEILASTALFLPLFAGGATVLVLSLIHQRRASGAQPPPLLVVS